MMTPPSLPVAPPWLQGRWYSLCGRCCQLGPFEPAATHSTAAQQAGARARTSVGPMWCSPDNRASPPSSCTGRSGAELRLESRRGGVSLR